MKPTRQLLLFALLAAKLPTANAFEYRPLLNTREMLSAASGAGCSSIGSRVREAAGLAEYRSFLAIFDARSAGYFRQRSVNKRSLQGGWSTAMLAGFASDGGDTEKKKEARKAIGPKGSEIKKQEKKFVEMAKAGGTVVRVYARLKDEDRWFPVGKVCTQADKIAEGVQGQKRLILDHAPALHLQLATPQARKQSMDLGYSMEDDGEVILCKATYSGEEVGLVLDQPSSGQYYKQTDMYGLRARIDTSSQFGQLPKQKKERSKRDAT